MRLKKKEIFDRDKMFKNCNWLIKCNFSEKEKNANNIFLNVIKTITLIIPDDIDDVLKDEIIILNIHNDIIIYKDYWCL